MEGGREGGGDGWKVCHCHARYFECLAGGNGRKVNLPLSPCAVDSGAGHCCCSRAAAAEPGAMPILAQHVPLFPFGAGLVVIVIVSLNPSGGRNSDIFFSA